MKVNFTPNAKTRIYIHVIYTCYILYNSIISIKNIRAHTALSLKRIFL